MTTNEVAGPELADATRQALRRLAGAVVVITTRQDGVRHAMAATAVNALSMDPPSMLACVNKSASIHDQLAKGGYFALNILGRDHVEVSHNCGGRAKGEARFDEGDWDNDGPAPVLRDAQAAIILKADGSFSYGSHSIFVGKVEEVRVCDGAIDPLIYINGTYAGVNSDE